MSDFDSRSTPGQPDGADEALRRLTFLAGAGDVLSSSLEYEQILQKVAQLAVPALGDLCIVDIFEEGRLRRVATTHVNSEKRELLERLRLEYPASEESPQPAGRVLRSGVPELLVDVTPDVVAAHTLDSEHASLIRAVGIRSHLAVPLVARGQTIGVISLGVTESAKRYGAQDVTLAQELARRAALAVDNARLYRAAQDELAERRRAEEALRLSEGRFRAVLEQSPLSIQIFGADGVALRVNRAWEQLWGVTLDMIPEYNVLRDPQLEALGIAPLIRRAFGGEAVELPAIRYDPEATLPDRSRNPDPVRWVSAFAYPLKDESGRVREVVLVHEDVTAERNAQEKLRASEERLRLALAAGRMNVWDWDLRTNVVECSDNALEFWGIQVGRASDFIAVIHPDDQAAVAEAARVAEAGESPYLAEYRLRSPDGAVRWVQSRGRLDRDEGGNAVRILGVTLDITELKAAQEKLRAEDRRKDEFLATLAHELRNPLAPIRTGLALLRSMPHDDASTRTLDVMDRQLAHMVRLIDDLLDLSRVTRGKVQLERERVDLWSLTAAALEASRPLIDAAGLHLAVRLPQEPVVLHVDRTRIAQVLSNLLNNAAKYTEAGGHVELEARLAGAEVVVRVTDTGIGIPREMLGHIFEMFAQTQRALARSQGGLGIGLTLVKRLVELHGGRVWAESEGPGRGSTFVVCLPAAPPVETTAQPAPAEVPVAGTHIPRRILVVDDNTDAGETLAAFLRLDNDDVRTAASGPAALELLRHFLPEIGFLDIGLPGMSGYDLARRIRQDQRLAGIVLVAVTGWGQAEDRRQSHEAGFDHHLTKPVDPRQVRAIVRASNR